MHGIAGSTHGSPVIPKIILQRASSRLASGWRFGSDGGKSGHAAAASNI
jgi:hypothetical protein